MLMLMYGVSRLLMFYPVNVTLPYSGLQTHNRPASTCVKICSISCHAYTVICFVEFMTKK